MNLRVAFRRNIDTVRANPLHELSGAVGDLGTYIPLLFALHLQGAVSLSASLIFNGIANVVAGLVFGLPVPVQPMKAIAAVSLLRGLTQSQTMAAGLFVAIAVGIMALTGVLGWVNRVVPVPVVKGIQLGAGLSLVLTAGGMFSKLHWITQWWDNNFWMLAFFVLLILTTIAPRFSLHRIPFALVALLAGIIISLIVLTPRNWPSISVPQPRFRFPGSPAWIKGITEAGIGQLPLTTLNSVIALHHLTLDLFDNRSPSVREYGISVCLINIGCFFGAMPICHGSGGLASQHLFGARSGASVMVLGLIKILIGVLTGNTFGRLLEKFPYAILGVMVFAAGLELARAAEGLNEDARDLGNAEGGERTGLLSGHLHIGDRDDKKKRFLIMLVTAATLLAFRNDGAGLLAGLLVHWGFYGDLQRFRFWRR